MFSKFKVKWKINVIESGKFKLDGGHDGFSSKSSME